MSLKYMGIPDRCPHGVYADPVHEGIACDKCEIDRLRARVAELEAIDYDAIARRMAQVMFETPVSYAISSVKVTDRTRELLGGDDAS